MKSKLSIKNMEENKVVISNFEDRLSKLRKKEKQNFFIRIGIVVFLFLFLIVYLVTPLSQVGNYHLKGNLNLSKSEVLKIAHLNRNTSLFLVDEKKCQELLNEHPLIKSSKVKTGLFTGLSVEIEELTPVLKRSNLYYLNDGSILDNALLDSPLVGKHLNNIIKLIPTDASNNYSYSKEQLVNYSNIYFNVEPSFRNSIDHFKITSDGNYEFFVLYNDIHYSVILDFSSSISYEDIAYAIDSDSFERYDNSIFSNDKISLEKQIYQNGETSFEYYSIKVIIKYEFATSKAMYSVYTANDQPVLEN